MQNLDKGNEMIDFIARSFFVFNVHHRKHVVNRIFHCLVLSPLLDFGVSLGEE